MQTVRTAVALARTTAALGTHAMQHAPRSRSELRPCPFLVFPAESRHLPAGHPQRAPRRAPDGRDARLRAAHAGARRAACAGPATACCGRCAWSSSTARTASGDESEGAQQGVAFAAFADSDTFGLRLGRVRGMIVGWTMRPRMEAGQSDSASSAQCSPLRSSRASSLPDCL
jgi:hypothetical protein